MSTASESLRRIPAVDQWLQRPLLQELAQRFSRPLVLSILQEELQRLRVEVRAGLSGPDFERRLEGIETRVDERLLRQLQPSLRKVVNASGVLVHTNVGRAPMAAAVAENLAQLATSYSNLEYDVEQGRRGHRDLHFERRATRLLGCEAATVCNNSAAALLLMLNSLARDRKVIVSRGELIEIGGSFRLPAVMEASGAVLKEVGTTNKTRLQDYREAIDGETAAILRVHPSNYKIIGFTQRPGLQELIRLARQRNLLLMEDAGSGQLFPGSQPFLKDEPAVTAELAAGLDLICFSGDKLLGGPQAGIIAGRRKLIQRIRKNPLMRACRVDKLTYAALEWTLIEYEKGTYLQSLPIYRMLSLSAEEVGRRARQLSGRLDPDAFEIELEPGFSLTGGGAAPEEPIPTTLLLLRPRRRSAGWLEARLRAQPVPIVARIEKDWVVLDLRTVFPEEEPLIAVSLNSIAAAQALPAKNQSDGARG